MAFNRRRIRATGDSETGIRQSFQDVDQINDEIADQLDSLAAYNVTQDTLIAGLTATTANHELRLTEIEEQPHPFLLMGA